MLKAKEAKEDKEAKEKNKPTYKVAVRSVNGSVVYCCKK